jgi:hypothetical protein
LQGRDVGFLALAFPIKNDPNFLTLMDASASSAPWPRSDEYAQLLAGFFQRVVGVHAYQSACAARVLRAG